MLRPLGKNIALGRKLSAVSHQSYEGAAGDGERAQGSDDRGIPLLTKNARNRAPGAIAAALDSRFLARFQRASEWQEFREVGDENLLSVAIYD
jgi:hypothetical protein